MKSENSSFSEIYSQWEKTHNEDKAIKDRLKTAVQKEAQVLTKTELKRMQPNDELDLHNCTLESSVRQVEVFLEDCFKRKLPKVRIITGKGLHSKDGKSVIKDSVTKAVSENKYVRSIEKHTKAADGGSGALIVYLKV